MKIIKLQKIFSRIFKHLTFWLWGTALWSQHPCAGVVRDAATGQPIAGATVVTLDKGYGVYTDSLGRFSLNLWAERRLVFTHVAYNPDTLECPHEGYLEVRLKPGRELISVNVEEARQAFRYEEGEKIELHLDEAALKKSACCNIGEAFETSGVVDVSYADAITGVKHIRLLGLDGHYVQLNADNMPSLRALAGSYGLYFIPGPFLQGICITKGPGSVVNGYESITGLINADLRTPEHEERFLANVFVNHLGRAEANIGGNFEHGKAWRSAVWAHGNFFRTPNDMNHDGFLDLPWHRQVNLMARSQQEGEKHLFQAGVRGVYDVRQAGQLAGPHVPAQPFTMQVTTWRTEPFIKLGLNELRRLWRKLGFTLSGIVHHHEGHVGAHLLEGTQYSLHHNWVYETIISDTRHNLRTGVSFNMDNILERYGGLRLERIEWIPGTFGEYTFKQGEKWLAVVGLRYDYNSLFGHFITPRFHGRWEPMKPLSLKISAGRGYRMLNIISENLNLMPSSRKLLLPAPLRPEVAWTYGVALRTTATIGRRSQVFQVDFFRTDFENKVVADMENPGELIFRNVRASAYSHSLQAEAQLNPTRGLDVRLTGKWNDVMAPLGGRVQQVLYVPRWRGLLNVAYTTANGRWAFDATLQLNGPARLPKVTHDKNSPFYATKSPVFPNLLAQVTYKTERWEIYVGGENLTHFRQKYAVIDPQNPFSNSFDATRVWGPIMGALGYLGVRYVIRAKEACD
ncbi:MAG: TonB-dependent receptor [Flavobacteriales bacterium]|nr:TonB-dependent receptor [Flavobacteriales bacterium]